MISVRLGAKAIGWSVAIGSVLTLVCAVLGHGHPSFPALSTVFAMEMTYSFAIGVPSSLIVPPLVRAAQPLSYRAALCIVLPLVVTIPCSLIGTWILVFAGFVPAAECWTRWARDVRIAIVVSLAIGTALAAYTYFRARLEKTQLELKSQELARVRAEQLASEAQLASLASRLQPHFLFNTLNSISSLIRTDPLRAERVLGRFAALLRATLDSRASELVPLHKELKLVADYLEIQHVRHPDRLRYELQVPPALLDQRVPPFSIQTLVENAVKYAVAPSTVGSMIRVVAAIREDRLCVDVWDEGPGFSAAQIAPNHGLDNLKARLRSIYAGAARLRFGRERLSARGPEQNRVAIELPLPSEVSE